MHNMRYQDGRGCGVRKNMRVGNSKRGRQQPRVEPEEGGQTIVCEDKGDRTKGVYLAVNYLPEKGWVVRPCSKIKWVLLEEPVDPRQVWFLEKFGGKFHEKAVILESQVFDAQTSSRFGCTDIFPGDEALSPGASFFGSPKEGSTNSV
jgi:hypothetical protein